MRLDLPVHKLDPTMLASGSFNVVVDPSGILRPRQGYTVTPGAAGPQTAITGGISWVGIGGALYTIVADMNGWWQYTAGAANPWNALATVPGATVGPHEFTQFASFPINGVDNLWGVNNNSQSGLLRWTAGSNSISLVPNTGFTGALDCFVLNNRLVVIAPFINGIPFPNQVRWSAFNDPTTWPSVATNTLADPGGSIVAGMRQGNLQAYLYLAGSEWTGAMQTMIAQAGDDSNAFAFQEFALGESVVPPVSVAAILPVNGVHYYLGVDGHVWQFNGIAPQNFGIRIQPDIAANANFSSLRHSFLVYVPGNRQLRVFYPSGQYLYPNRCVYYSFDFDRWEAPALYNQRFRSGFTGPFQSSTQLAALVGGLDGELLQLDTGSNDNGTPIQFAATWGARNTDPLEKMQVQFAEAFIQQASANDFISFVVTGLRNPLDAATQGAVYLIKLSAANQFQQVSAPSRNPEFFNWIQASLQGTTTAGFASLGAYIHVNTTGKGIYNVNARGPE